MKLNYARINGFGSYDDIFFRFDNRGLTLVEGHTGAGKSTIFDSVTWCLFGKTFKDSSANAVISWNSKQAKVEVNFTCRDDNVTVVREKGKINDLYYFINSDTNKLRGSNVINTQNQLEEYLGFDFSSFASACYYSEFSPASLFFLSPAKVRRELFNRFVDLSFPNTLTELLKSKLSAINKSNSDLERDYTRACMGLEMTENRIKQVKQNENSWEIKKKDIMFQRQKYYDVWDIDRENKLQSLIFDIKKLEESIENFDKSKVKKHCDSCGQVLPVSKELRAEKMLETAKQHYKNLLNQNNPYEQLLKEPIENPIREDMSKLTKEFNHYLETKESAKKLMENAIVKKSDVEYLISLTSIMRAELLQNTVIAIQNFVNGYLINVFESDFRVNLELSGDDDLSVVIAKGANECDFRQLSKGQRQLLRLTFCLACMKIAQNKLGVHFKTLFFDEPTDGCDSDLKIKSYNLFNRLAQDFGTIFVVDHSVMLQGMFSNRIKVSLVQGKSVLIEE